MKENAFDGFVETTERSPLTDEALKNVVGGSIGRTTYGVYGSDGRFLGYSTNTGF